MYEQQPEEKRRMEIGQIFIFSEDRPAWLQLYRISEKWWLDVENVELQQVKECMQKKFKKINNDLFNLSNLEKLNLAGYEETALAEYKRTLDYKQAIKRAQKQQQNDEDPNSASYKSKLYKNMHTWKNKKT